MHCSIHRHDKINQTFNNVTGKPTFFFGVRTTKYEDNYILKSGCPQDNHFLKQFLRPWSFYKLWRICTSCTPTPYINTWYKGSMGLQQSQKINFFLLEIQEKQLKSQAWEVSMVPSRHGPRLRSGKGCCQVKPNSGETKAWYLKMGTEKLALVALVRPSRIYTYPRMPDVS